MVGTTSESYMLTKYKLYLWGWILRTCSRSGTRKCYRLFIGTIKRISELFIKYDCTDLPVGMKDGFDEGTVASAFGANRDVLFITNKYLFCFYYSS